MSRQDQYSVTLTLTLNNETLSLGIWDKFDGGEVDSEETRYRPGAMGAEISLGGFVTVGNVTLSKLFDQAADLPRLGKMLLWVGRAQATAIKQPLSVTGVPVGKALKYQGTLKRVSPPAADSESSAPGLIEVELTSPQVSM